MYTIWHKTWKKNVTSFDIKYGEINIKQYDTVTCLGCLLNGTLPGEPMALKFIKKIISRLRFLYKIAGSCLCPFVDCFVTL